MGMSGSSMYTDAVEYGVSDSNSYGGQGFGRAGVSSAAVDLAIPSVGAGASTPTTDSRIATQVRTRRGGMEGPFRVEMVFYGFCSDVWHVSSRTVVCVHVARWRRE